MHGGSNGSTPGYVGTTSANTLFVFAIVVVATIGGFIFGYDSGVINGTQDGLQRAFSLTRFATGFNVAAILVGCAVGAFIAGRLADLIGRRTVMIITGLTGAFLGIYFLAKAAGSSTENPAHRVGRYWPGRVPAARRHQHRLLLRHGAVGVSGLQ
jgi:MFS transporter, SP family, sugar:H+ symporter